MKKKLISSLPRIVLTSVLLYFILFEILTSLFVSVNIVSSRSMIPNILPLDRLVVSRIDFGITLPFSEFRVQRANLPERGALVVIHYPTEDRIHIPVLSDFWNFITLNTSLFRGRRGQGEILRRVIALPGDMVYLSGGRAYVRVGDLGDVGNGGAGNAGGGASESGSAARGEAGSDSEGGSAAGGEAGSDSESGITSEGGIDIDITNGRASAGRGEFTSEFEFLGNIDLNLPEGEFDSPHVLNNFYTGVMSVGVGEVFVLPDNRLEAFGSESWGSIPLSQLRGRVLLRF